MNFSDLDKTYSTIFGRLHGALNRPDGGIHLALSTRDILSFCGHTAWGLVPDHIRTVERESCVLLPPAKREELRQAMAKSCPAFAAYLDLVFLEEVADLVIQQAGEEVAAKIEARSHYESPVDFLLRSPLLALHETTACSGGCDDCKCGGG